MEMGVGIHGEPGRRRVKLAAADAIADEMVRRDPRRPRRRKRHAVPPARQRLRRHAADGALPDVPRRAHGSSRARRRSSRARSSADYVTSLDMAGCSITVTLLDDELTRLWDAPVHTAALRWGM